MAIKAIINNIEKEIEQIKNSDEQDIDYVYSRIGDTEVEGEPPISIKSIGGNLSNYRIYGNTVSGESVGDLVTDSQSEHYGEYAIPITSNSEIANIYLNEPLRMVEDETEYVDYETQKWHRVRKNLLQNIATSQTRNGVTFTVNSDGSVTCNGTASATIDYRMVALNSYSLPAGNYRLTGAPPTANYSSYYLRAWDNSSGSVKGVIDIGNGTNFSLTDTTILLCAIIIAPQQVLNNVTFYPMIRKAGIEDDTYEPYIENTEVDVTLPALSTIKGTNTFSVNTSIQPSNIYIKDSFDYKRIFTATRAIEDELPLNYRNIEDNDSALKNYRIYGNTVGGAGVGDLVESGEHAGEYNVPVIISRKAKHTATLQLHDCLPTTMQFDVPEALYYAENGLAAGTYNFTIQDSYDTAYGGGKTYQFTLANDVPAKGQLVFGWAYNTQASAAKITSYASSISTTAIERVGVTEGSGGTSLGTTDGNSTNVNHIHRARYGSNNYKESAIRQFLNCNAVAGSVWTPQTKYDRPPSWNSNTAGFMKDIDSDFLAALGTSPKVVALNTVTDGGGSVTINNDKFFLLSRSEVYGGKENNINEGEPYPYYSNYSDRSAAGIDDDSNRIKYRSGTAQVWWLRSPNSAYGGSVHCVSASGYVGYNYAYVSFGVAPACNIELDDNYAYKGQILHVRDQISVTKGNTTLVFDVIGIDHDDVDFDVTSTNLYLPEPIKMVGSEAEYVDYAEQKLHRVGADDIDVTLPELPTLTGTNVLSVGTAVQPSEVYIKGKLKRTI